MMKRIALILLAATAIAVAQQPAPPPAGHGYVYRLEYTITETEGTKKNSSRTYVLMVADHKQGKTRIGNRLPLATGQSQFQYFDVGANIDARPGSIDATSLNLLTTVDISSVVAESGGSGKAPVTRQFTNSIETVIFLDKPTVLAIQDQPGDNTTVQVQVLAKLVK